MLQFSNLTVSRANIKKVANFVLKCWWQNKSLLAAPLIGIMYPWLAKADEMLRKDRCAFTIQSVFLFKIWTLFYLPIIWPQRLHISHLPLNSIHSFTFLHLCTKWKNTTKTKNENLCCFPVCATPTAKLAIIGSSEWGLFTTSSCSSKRNWGNQQWIGRTGNH